MTVDIGGQATNFQKLPANADLADFGNNIVIATNRDAMSSEIKSMKQRSLDVINSMELHNSIINGCDEILKILNPEIAEKQRQEEENKALREEINSLKEMFSEFINQFKSGKYKPKLLFDDNQILERIINHPMAMWRTRKS